MKETFRYDVLFDIEPLAEEKRERLDRVMRREVNFRDWWRVNHALMELERHFYVPHDAPTVVEQSITKRAIALKGVPEP